MSCIKLNQQTGFGQMTCKVPYILYRFCYANISIGLQDKDNLIKCNVVNMILKMFITCLKIASLS